MAEYRAPSGSPVPKCFNCPGCEKTFSNNFKTGLANTARHFAECQMHQICLCPFAGCARSSGSAYPLARHFTRRHGFFVTGTSIGALVERSGCTIQPDYVRRRIKVVSARPECRGAFTAILAMQKWRQKHPHPGDSNHNHYDMERRTRNTE